jgi:hypothetical protein
LKPRIHSKNSQKSENYDHKSIAVKDLFSKHSGGIVVVGKSEKSSSVGVDKEEEMGRKEKNMRQKVYERLYGQKINNRCMSDVYHSDLNGLLTAQMTKSTLRVGMYTTNYSDNLTEGASYIKSHKKSPIIYTK